MNHSFPYPGLSSIQGLRKAKFIEIREPQGRAKKG